MNGCRALQFNSPQNPPNFLTSKPVLTAHGPKGAPAPRPPGRWPGPGHSRIGFAPYPFRIPPIRRPYVFSHFDTFQLRRLDASRSQYLGQRRLNSWLHPSSNKPENPDFVRLCSPVRLLDLDSPDTTSPPEMFFRPFDKDQTPTPVVVVGPLRLRRKSVTTLRVKFFYAIASLRFNQLRSGLRPSLLPFGRMRPRSLSTINLFHSINEARSIN